MVLRNPDTGQVTFAQAKRTAGSIKAKQESLWLEKVFKYAEDQGIEDYAITYVTSNSTAVPPSVLNILERFEASFRADIPLP